MPCRSLCNERGRVLFAGLSDLNVWQTAYTKATSPLTVNAINDYYGGLAYYKPLEPTVKKNYILISYL